LLRRQAESGVEIFVAFEDASVSGGLGDAMRGVLDSLPRSPRLLGFGWPRDAFPPHASGRDDLLALFRLRPQDAAEAVLAALTRPA
ncbi:MAG: hypothetical protein IJ678_09305, partial [Kiritimatiellae bacterium]|nr:hypothetical protein [Kiritimatiellia bacterium]